MYKEYYAPEKTPKTVEQVLAELFPKENVIYIYGDIKMSFENGYQAKALLKESGVPVMLHVYPWIKYTDGCYRPCFFEAEYNVTIFFE